ncbi:hypothetical protein GXP67_19520 [Rhodocytophaga rosea]|uniref:Site-specific integrase n=1 Tax=Rhodocytophaga rosea TaxID=2704465 RepID=A0A6C0GKV4_9BACT|nr:site-specific integrase [Rhodocytophaga rosea]QHT68676.1 hypothetical protein GXP67_19520 [Rhodocytophaga rosea]
MKSKESFSLKFFIIPQPDNIHAKIFLRITVDRKKVEMYTGSTIRIDMWNEAAQQAKSTKKTSNTGVNEDLLKLKNQITDIKRRLQYEGKPISSKLIKDIHTGAVGEKHFLLEYFNDHISQLEKLSKEYSKGTIKNYRVTYKHLQNFIISKRLKDIELLQVDTKFINDFDFHLMTYISSDNKSAMDRNSANRQHKRLKAVLHKGMKEEILDKDPYNSFKIKDNTVNRTFLSEEEIELLKKHDLGNNLSLQKVRDIFLFSIYTGLRFGDASQLKTNHVSKDNKGQYWTCNKIVDNKLSN